MSLPERLGAAARTVWARLFEPVDLASVVFFRIAFGTLLVVEVARYFANGWIRQFYIDPQFHFTYYGFSWVRPLPGNGMYVLFAILGVFGLCIVLGYKYRVATTLFFLGFTWVFLLDQTRYLNHFYLITLISFLLIFVPAHRAFSLDAKFEKGVRASTVPRWALWILLAQFSLMYVYAGIAKINADWLRGSPMRGMLARHTSLPWVGPHLTDERVVMTFAYGGLAFDLFIVPLLLWSKTRWFALLWAAAFHGMNHQLFEIGIFPFFAMAGTLLFLPPDWPRRVWSAVAPATAFLRRGAATSSPEKAATGVTALQTKRARKVIQPQASRAVVVVLSAYFALQILLPLRHFLYPGPVDWTDEGHRFSWRMMLRSKQGRGRFMAIDRLNGQRRFINPSHFLARDQVSKMWVQPDTILQFVHYMANRLRAEGWEVVEIRSSVAVSLNGRKAQMFVDPTVNLAAEKRNLMPAGWILPLKEPLPRPGAVSATDAATPAQ